MHKATLLLGSMLIITQGCSTTAITSQQDTFEPEQSEAQQPQVVTETNSEFSTFSDEKQAWLASEEWSYHGNGLAKNVGWNDQTHSGDLNFTAGYSNNPSNCTGELFITGPFYSNRISGIFNVNGQDVHFKYVNKINDNARLYRPKNPAGLEFVLSEFGKGEPVIIKSDIGMIATFPSNGFEDAKRAIDKECIAKMTRDKNAL
ncbi:hypothetical protein VIN01S_30360 [Vibrio inusitatus NBRC 102082]|uniref:Lipoprotein n=1 Tax=Vibrio inusitatus NBRC 102082 TaxID=1219070 RepID=A0A4Y3I045_9VIBR|nr:hypothetical protein [Vibrio inusitatus]GEA52232.1 hypothetical protein VIN01S_30360 [Vibrio inusitatus NBRC 102082]